MFSQCKSLEELSSSRVSILQSGVNPLEVNKSYEKRKREILSGASLGYKRVKFVSVPIPENLDVVVGVDFAYEDERSGIHIFTGVMNKGE